MTYFSVQPRKLSNYCQNNSSLGPGYYNSEVSSLRKYSTHYQSKYYNQQAYAPFGSLQKKKLAYCTANKDCQLGPGEYQVSGKICKPSITKYENNNCIIIKINDQGSSQFKSRLERFKTSPTHNQTPGPGQYEVLNQTTNKKAKSFSKGLSSSFSSNKKKPKSSIGQRIKQLNLKNYIQRRKPTLTVQDLQPKKPFSEQNNKTKNKFNKQNHRNGREYTQKNSNDLNISHNFQQDSFKNKQRTKGVAWSLNNKQRFQPLIKQEFTEKHREEIIQKIRTDKNLKSRQKNIGHSASAVFASKSLKSNLQRQIYQTSNPFKVQLRKMIDYKDQRPGPGSYQIKGTLDEKYSRPAKHQFFGSTVDRFTSLNEEDLGPGYYQPKIVTFSQHKKNYKKPFQNTTNFQEAQNQRCSYIQLDSSIPGPGAYNTNYIALAKSTTNKTSCRWVFGSKIPRFQNEKVTTKVSNQGQQILNIQQQQRQFRKQQEYQYRKQLFQTNKKSSSFISKTKRLFEEINEKQNKIQDCVPTPGQYDISQNDISTRLKKIIQKNKQIATYHSDKFHPFNSSIQRFKTEGSIKNQNQNVHKDCWCLVKSVQKQVFQHQSPAFMSKQKRIIVFDNRNKDIPAIGTYTKTNIQSSSLIKNSFNSKFLKAGFSKSKKISLWTKSNISNINSNSKIEQQSLLKIE